MASSARYDGFDRMPIAGTWRPGSSGKAATDTDPYTGETLTEIQLADANDLDAAYTAARDAQRSWAATLPGEKAAVMRRAAAIMDDRKDEIVDWIIRETGAAAPVAEFQHAITVRDFHEAASYPYRVEGRILPADIEGKESRVYRRPVGVVAVISPWNVPLHLSNRSVAPALALGNGVVLKPAGDTPVCGGLLLAKILEEAGLPEGLFSVVIGSGSEIGDAIVEHPVPRVVSFTGSTPVGKGIAQKAGLKKLSLELGGNGPLVVLDDADLGYAVDAAVFGKFFHQGQVCMITNRIVVDGSVHDEFVDRYVERVRRLAAGDRSSTASSWRASRRRSPRPARTARGSCWAVIRPARSARCCRRTCCSAATTSPPPDRRCSGRWSRSSRPPARTTLWRSPTTPSTASPAPSSPRTPSAASGSRCGSRPA
jgi:aldehyde dehydrogenase (NAD+)